MMHPWISMLLALTTFAVTACGGTQPQDPSSPAASSGTGDDASLPPAPTVSGPDARRLVAAGAFLLDVTPPPRNAESEIDGRTNIPLPELQDRLSEVPRDRTVVVYCYGGRGSPRGGAILQAEGYDARVLGARSRWDEDDDEDED